MIALLDTNIVLAQVSTDENAPNLAGFSDLRLSALTYSAALIGLGATRDVDVYRERSARLRRIQATYGAGIPFDDRCVDAMERIGADLAAAGRKPRGRIVDLMIAATAISHDLTLITRNTADFAGIAGLRVEAR